MEKLRVNIKTKVMNSAIRHEKRNGRDVVVVPSATLPDNIVMNRIMYPAAVTEKNYRTLDKTPAPLGHPFVNNEYIPATEPEAINGFWVGAWNENVRRQNGRVFLDKVIDVEVAQSTERGRALLEAINKKEPIHTSTGLFLEVDKADSEDYDWIATNMVADHDAILIGEDGAATPEQGVGIFVNSKGERVKVDASNAEVQLDDDAIASIAETMAWRLEHEAEEEKRKPLVEAITAKIRALLDGLKVDDDTVATNGALSVNKNSEGQKMSDEKLDKLQEEIADLKTNALTTDGVKAIFEEVVKPIADTVAEMQANKKAEEEAERTGLIEKVVKANLFDEADAKELSTNHLRKLAEKVKPGESDGVFGGFSANKEDPDTMSDELPGGDE